jgi:hypothetical protein
MNRQTARQLLPLYRSGQRVDSRVEKAVRLAECDEPLRQELGEQMDFDEQVMDVIRCIRAPDDLRQRLTALSDRSQPAERKAPRHWLNPAILSAVLGLGLLIGFLVYLKMESSSNFPGRDWAEDLVEITDRMTGAELEATQLRVGELGDNMMLRGFDGYKVPPEIETLPTVGWRVFRHNGHKVAQVVIEDPPMVAFVLRAADFGMQPGAGRDWQIFSHERWAVAAKSSNGVCTVLSIRGNESAMTEALNSLKP